MTSARTLTVLVVTAALSPLLAGCSDDATSAPLSPSPTTSAATSAAPSSTPAPDLSIAPPGETAQEFIRRWIELGNRMQATGKTADVLAVSGPDCSTCRGFAESVKEVYSAGGRIEGGTDTIVSAKAESKTQWLLKLRAAPTVIVEASGNRVRKFSGGPYTTRLYLGEVNGRWIVGETEVLGK